jgi:hypothetical protein
VVVRVEGAVGLEAVRVIGVRDLDYEEAVGKRRGLLADKRIQASHLEAVQQSVLGGH